MGGLVINDTIYNGTLYCDPSSAWQNLETGEWRLTTSPGVIIGSMDFKHFYEIGIQPGFAPTDDPSFFPLPRITPGSGAAPIGASTPTHVYKGIVKEGPLQY